MNDQNEKEFASVFADSDARLSALERLPDETEGLDDLHSRAKRVLLDRGVNPDTLPNPVILTETTSKKAEVLSWSELVSGAQERLGEARHTSALIPDTDLQALYDTLNRPMWDRLPWDKWDFAFAFGIGIIGGVLDLFVGTPNAGLQAKLTDKNHWLGEFSERVHNKHPGHAPIDYQGFKFGGGDHRSRTVGHDLLRFIEGIRQFRDGQFKGWYFLGGNKIDVVTNLNQYGRAYNTTGTADAITQYIVHMFCDFFSSRSLPIPGTSVLYGSSNRATRIISQDLYKNGVNLRHASLQAAAVAFVQIGCWVYNHFRTQKLEGVEEARQQKSLEISTLALSVMASFNVGKVAITKNPYGLNMPLMASTAMKVGSLVLSEHRRTSFVSQWTRNAEELERSFEELEQQIEHVWTGPDLLLVG